MASKSHRALLPLQFLFCLFLLASTLAQHPHEAEVDKSDDFSEFDKNDEDNDGVDDDNDFVDISTPNEQQSEKGIDSGMLPLICSCLSSTRESFDKTRHALFKILNFFYSHGFILIILLFCLSFFTRFSSPPYYLPLLFCIYVNFSLLGIFPLTWFVSF